MKIFASSFTDRMITGTIIEKCKIRSKEVVKGSRDLLFKFLDSLHIVFKFGTNVDHDRHYTDEKCEIGQRGWEGIM